MSHGLPLEVWHRIIPYLLSWNIDDTPNHAEFISNFFTVCRWWKDIAEPTLYRDLHIWRFEQSQALALRMITSTSSRPGSWIKSLTVHFCDWNLYDYSTFWEDITIVLLNAPNLTTFSSEYADVTISVSAFATLSKIASSRISQLCVCFDGRNAASMHIITRFPLLEDLEVTFDADTKPDFTGVEPWIIPTVRTFSWRYDALAGSPDGDSLRFLSACRFGSGCRIFLDFSNPSSNESVALNPFFDAHQDAEAINLCLWAPISESSTVFSIQNVEFEASPPPAILFTQERLPQRVSTRVDLRDIDDEEYPFWDILDVLESHGKLERSLVLRLWLVSYPGFSWHRDAGRDHLSEEYISFVGRLLPRALRLYSRGVIIMDENGEEVHTRIPKAYKNAPLQTA